MAASSFFVSWLDNNWAGDQITSLVFAAVTLGCF